MHSHTIARCGIAQRQQLGERSLRRDRKRDARDRTSRFRLRRRSSPELRPPAPAYLLRRRFAAIGGDASSGKGCIQQRRSARRAADVSSKVSQSANDRCAAYLSLQASSNIKIGERSGVLCQGSQSKKNALELVRVLLHIDQPGELQGEFTILAHIIGTRATSLERTCCRTRADTTAPALFSAILPIAFADRLRISAS